MCTVSVLLSPHDPFPLVVAANRDEARSRAALPPELWASPGPVPFAAGVDEVGGGTWLGLSRAGLFVALTNLWWADFMRPRPRSRGAVVTDLLGHARTLDEALARLRRQPLAELGPFNLVCATTAGLGFVASATDRLDVQPLPAGISVVSNRPPGEPWEKTRQVRDDLRAADREDSDALIAALARHTADRNPQQSVCVHTERDYGTVSSAVLAVGADLAQGAWRYAHGPPCVTPFVDRSALLAELAATPLRRLGDRSRDPSRPDPSGDRRGGGGEGG